jgi:hypothetical protein
MSIPDLSRWQHAHDFGTPAEQHAGRRTRWVLALTFVTLLAIAALRGGMLFGWRVLDPIM